MIRFTREHEWIRLESDGTATVGITDHAQEQLGDLVYVELPEPGRAVTAGEEMAVVESTKAASDVYAPLAGEVVGVNDALADNPGLVNEAPEGDGWMVKIALADPSAFDGLMDADAYAALVAEAG